MITFSRSKNPQQLLHRIYTDFSTGGALFEILFVQIPHSVFKHVFGQIRARRPAILNNSEHTGLRLHRPEARVLNFNLYTGAYA